MKRRNFISSTVLALPAISIINKRPVPVLRDEKAQHCTLIQSGELQAIVGDNSRNGVGGMQYCGLWSLTNKQRVFNCFGNSYAGLLPGELRGAEGVILKPLDDQSAELYKLPADKSLAEVHALYKMIGTNSMEHTLTVKDGRSRLNSLGYKETGWCSYMNSPEDIRLHFLSGGKMVSYISPKHGVGSRVAPSYIPASRIEKTPPQDANLKPFHVHFADLKFDAPFYYGRIGNMILLYVFDNPQNLRFYCSPSGGGSSLVPGNSSPAWDFLWLTPGDEYKTGKEYTFRMRLVYKPFISDDDVLRESEKILKEWNVTY